MDLLKQLEEKSLRTQLLNFAPCLAAHESSLQAFTKLVIENNLENDWRLPIYLIEWLPSLASSCVKSLMTTAVIRWSLQGLAHISAKGILLTSQSLPNVGIGLWKSSTAYEGHKLIEVSLKNCQQDAYLISLVSKQWLPQTWFPIVSPAPLCKMNLRDIVS